MSIPAYFDKTKVATLFDPDLAGAAAAGAAFAKDQGIRSAKEATQSGETVNLVLIDCQRDFCHPGITLPDGTVQERPGSLYVPGADGDMLRICEFIYNNFGRINHITASLDSHYLFQIFHPGWWIDPETGGHPAPFTFITSADIASNKWLPVKQLDWSLQYVRDLEQRSKKQLCIWPLHCIIGSPGACLDPALMEAIFYHAAGRASQYNMLEKGKCQVAEQYSILKTEVPVPGDPRSQIDTRMLDGWAKADRIYFAGEAKSHCFLETLADVVEYFGKRPEVLRRLYILEDATSNVVVPGVDFEEINRPAFEEFAKKGVNFVKTTDPLPAAA